MALIVLVAAILTVLWVSMRGGGNASVSAEYTRLTNFPDSVHSPALSKDGKTLAFVRGPEPFTFGSGEIYLKILPDGQPVALTHDRTPKMAPVFTPDGSRIVYTVSNNDWSSFSVPVAGGEPALLMPKAAGLRWVSPGRVPFSEIRTQPLMGLVTSGESREEPRDVYFPASRNGMVHFSEVSPDRNWILAVEMNANAWIPCRLLPFDGSSSGRQVGPPGAPCTAATWSPDGKWMYFVAEAGGESHLWRQSFPDGKPDERWAVVWELRGTLLLPLTSGKPPAPVLLRYWSNLSGFAPCDLVRKWPTVVYHRNHWKHNRRPMERRPVLARRRLGSRALASAARLATNPGKQRRSGSNGFGICFRAKR